MQIKMSLWAAMKWQKVTILVCTLAIFPVLSVNTFAQEETQSKPLEEGPSLQINDDTSEANVEETTVENQENINPETPVSNTGAQESASNPENTAGQESAARQESIEQAAPTRVVKAPRARPPSGQVATLGSTIVGNQEQPQVLYIVPWKPVGDSDLENQNIQSQLDIIFGHVERVELRRELLYMEQFANADEEAESN